MPEPAQDHDDVAKSDVQRMLRDGSDYEAASCAATAPPKQDTGREENLSEFAKLFWRIDCGS